MTSEPDIRVAQARDLLDDGGPDAGDMRVLVDRLWPRGVRKERLVVDEWAKEAAPSTPLRQAYHRGEIEHDEFARRYRDELAASGEAVALGERAARAATLTLVTAVRDVDASHVPVLIDALRSSLAG